MNKYKRNLHYYIFLGLFFIISNSSPAYTLQEQKNQLENKYPETYEEAINKVLEILDDKTKNIIKDIPKFSVGTFNHIIHDNNLINYKNHDFLKSCAEKIGKKYVHFEEVTYIVLKGVWDKLNSDLILVDFDKIEHKDYFNSIITTISLGKQNERLGYLSSLPKWIFFSEAYSYSYSDDDINRSKLLEQAKILAQTKNKNSYLGLLYLTYFGQNSDNEEEIIDDYYKNHDDFFEIPSFKLTYENTSSKSIEKSKLIGVNYIFTKTSYNEFALKCYNIFYNKNFNSKDEYEQFLNYCNTNYLATWKFLKTLTVKDYEKLINEPLKLIEVLTLTKKYFFKNGHNTELFEYATDESKPLVNYIELQDSISTKQPYLSKHFINYYHYDDELNNKSVNALKLIADKLEIEEILDIINPKSIEDYNNSIKTDDFIDYKYLISFIIVSQQQRLLEHSNKEKVFEILNYYRNTDFISWPFNYFITDLLIQIDTDKAIKVYKHEFEKNPNSGSFMRHAILSSIIEYDFDKNSKFIEEWYWIVHDKDFNYSPEEHKYILELLNGKDKNTLDLYNRIIGDIRYKE
tara:strand:- start:122 stop:1843 length:1722 start_codon:yes stop_codon:yes gene_type:complete